LFQILWLTDTQVYHFTQWKINNNNNCLY